MNLILAEYDTRYRIEQTQRELEGRRLAALASRTTVSSSAFQPRLTRVIGRLRLTRRGSAA